MSILEKTFKQDKIITAEDLLKVINEVVFKKVVRQGKIVKKAQCPDGMKFQGGKCVRISSKERINRKKAGKKTALKVRAKSKQIAKKRARSNKKRRGF